MGQAAKYFRWIFFICTFFLSAYAAAQVGSGYPNAYKGFVTDKLQANESPFLLVIVNKKNQDFLFKDPSIKIKRQLDDSAFIISINRKLTDASLTKATWIAKANNNWKLSPTLLSSLLSEQLIFPNKFLIMATQTSALTKWLDEKKVIFSKTSNANTFIITISSTEILNELISQSDVDFAGIYHTKPNYELQINDLDLSANKINKAHSKYPSLNGEGLTLSIKENLPDTNDIDIKGRYIANTIAPANINPHSTIMATMAAGAGNSWYTGKGVANAVSFTSSDFSNLLPDENSNYQQYNISVQNHSYGVGIENFYGADAAAYDAAASTNDKLLFVFSAGNSGTASSTNGNYAGINAVANLTGSFKQAKNILTVGAIDSFGVVAAASSKGPAYDGRIKPEMVAYGLDGTSGAAALVSGTALLLHQAYKNNNGGNLPSSSLVKAVLLNSSDEINHAPISFQSGYGNLNAEKAISDIAAQHYFAGTIANTAIQTFSISIPANISKAKFTLVWNDTATAPNAFKALVNDLDLEIHDNAGTAIWKPWVLNSSANIDSLTLSPVRKRDSLNNIEQVTIDNPLPGNYTIVIKGFQINTSTQAFAIAYHLDTAASFTWDFPTATDNIFPSSSNLIRWDENIVAANAQLSYSVDAGASWQSISNNIDLSKKYFRWDAPDTNALGILKMHIGTQSFVSDTFTISRKTDFKVGFNCADSVLWYWNTLNGTNSYQLYGLGNKYLEPISITTDTQFVFNKNTLAYKWFAVAPIINSRIGIKSYATDYSTQGTDCYIKDFTADLVNDNNASLQLTLGSLYLIKKIVFEKISGNEFTAIKTISSFSGLDYTFTDNALLTGNNVYRISIELQDGRVIRSFTTTVFFFAAEDVVAYPNPVQQNTNLHLQFKNLQNQQVRIYDIAGRLVHQQTATSTQMDILATFAKGLYGMVIYNPETNQKNVKKILVR